MAQRTRKPRAVQTAPNALDPLAGSRETGVPVQNTTPDVAMQAPAVIADMPMWSDLIGEDAISDPSQIADGVITPAHFALDTPTEPTGLTALTGLNPDGSAYILIEWVAVDGAVAYDVEWKRSDQIVFTYTRTTDASASLRIEGLIPNTSYDYSVSAVNALGNSSGFPAPLSVTTSSDTTAPATPSGAAAAAGVKSVIISFTANTEADLDHYVIEVYSDAGLTTLVKTFTGLATVWAYNAASPNTQYWARVKAVDTSGNSSAWTSTLTATTSYVANSDIQAGTITGDRIVAGSVTAADAIFAAAAIQTADIHDAAITNAKINDLAVDKLTAGTLSAAVILSGSFKTATSGLRSEIDSSGIRLYGYVAPYVRSWGADSSGTGAVTVALPDSHYANDIIVLLVTTQGNETAPTTPTGYTKEDEVASGSTSSDTRLTVFWKRDGGSETAPSLASTAKRQTAFSIAVAGCVTTGNPFDVKATSSESTADTSASITGATDTVPNALILLGISAAYTTDVGPIYFFTSLANTNLTDLSEVKESAAYSGTSKIQRIGAMSGVSLPVGAYGATTMTLDQSSTKAMWSGAMKAAIGATVNMDSTTGNAAFAGTISGSKMYTPGQTGDRGVIGRFSVDGLLGAGISVFRNADIENDLTTSGIIDFLLQQGFPQGAGTGNQTEVVLAAVGSDDNNKSSNSSPLNNIQYAEVILLSGYYHSAIGPSVGPQIQFNFSHYNSTGSLLATGAYLELINTSNEVSLTGVQYANDIKQARNLVQQGGATLTYPGASTRTNNASITFPQAWASGGFSVATAPRTGSGTTFGTLCACIGSVGGTSFTLTGLQVAEGTPANGSTVSANWIAVNTLA